MSPAHACSVHAQLPVGQAAVHHPALGTLDYQPAFCLQIGAGHGRACLQQSDEQKDGAANSSGEFRAHHPVAPQTTASMQAHGLLALTGANKALTKLLDWDQQGPCRVASWRAAHLFSWG